MKSIFVALALSCLFLIVDTPINAQGKSGGSHYKTGRSMNKSSSQLQNMNDQAQNASVKQNDDPYVDEKGKLHLPLKESPAVEVKEIYESMSAGRQPGIRALIPHSNPMEVLTNWQLYLKELGIKSKGRNSEIVSANAMLPNLSDKPVDIHAVAEPFKGGTYLKVFTNLGGGFFTGKSPSSAICRRP